MSMTKMMAANCDKEAPSEATVVFPGQSQTSRGITVLSKMGIKMEMRENCETRTLFDVL